MVQATRDVGSICAFEAAHLVRYDDLVSCRTAFIDTRTPGSERKENFTIIGPGVAENPDQHVHITTPHGFNIGGARQPPGCVNSQHSHETAEVFIVHSGRWAFRLGENAEDAEVVLEAGDTISIPTRVFRGFENVGDDSGFLFAVLGGDDPGRVLWAPYVFEQAEEYGLVLMEDGSLYDNGSGAPMPSHTRPQTPTGETEVAALDRLDNDQLRRCVLRYNELTYRSIPERTINEAPIIGAAGEGLGPAPLDWPHGFHVRCIELQPGTEGSAYSFDTPEVLLGFRGEIDVELPAGRLRFQSGDTLSVPAGVNRQLTNRGSEAATLFVVRGGDAIE
ncbi:MAG: cupin domain-containing protein [Pseudomonadota bacterium]